jgi:hypothetical protein
MQGGIDENVPSNPARSSIMRQQLYTFIASRFSRGSMYISENQGVFAYMNRPSSGDGTIGLHEDSRIQVAPARESQARLYIYPFALAPVYDGSGENTEKTGNSRISLYKLLWSDVQTPRQFPIMSQVDSTKYRPVLWWPAFNIYRKQHTFSDSKCSHSNNESDAPQFDTLSLFGGWVTKIPVIWLDSFT